MLYNALRRWDTAYPNARALPHIYEPLPVVVAGKSAAAGNWFFRTALEREAGSHATTAENDYSSAEGEQKLKDFQARFLASRETSKSSNSLPSRPIRPYDSSTLNAANERINRYFSHFPEWVHPAQIAYTMCAPIRQSDGSAPVSVPIRSDWTGPPPLPIGVGIDPAFDYTTLLRSRFQISRDLIGSSALTAAWSSSAVSRTSTNTGLNGLFGGAIDWVRQSNARAVQSIQEIFSAATKPTSDEKEKESTASSIAGLLWTPPEKPLKFGEKRSVNPGDPAVTLAIATATVGAPENLVVSPHTVLNVRSWINRDFRSRFAVPVHWVLPNYASTPTSLIPAASTPEADRRVCPPTLLPQPPTSNSSGAGLFNASKSSTTSSSSKGRTVFGQTPRSLLSVINAWNADALDERLYQWVSEQPPVIPKPTESTLSDTITSASTTSSVGSAGSGGAQ